MKRRTFLQRTGVVIAGGSATAGVAIGAEPGETTTLPDAARRKKDVLITSADSELGRAVAERLNDLRPVRLTGTTDIDTRFPFTKSDLGHGPSTDALVEGVEVIVHIGLAPPGASGTQWIDYRTRATYNLLRAAAGKDVRRVIYLSSLEIMLGYDPQFMITEDFAAQPTPDPQTLSHHLGEFTCREFARSSDLEVVVLRLGRLEGLSSNLSSARELPRTETQDVTAAVAAAIGSQNDDNRPDFGPWTVVHIHSEAASDRFPLTKAGRLLHYQPKRTGAAP